MTEFDIYTKSGSKVTIEGDTWTDDDDRILIFMDKSVIAYFKKDCTEGFVIREQVYGDKC